MITSLGVGRAEAGVIDSCLYPFYRGATNMAPVIYAHGLGGDASQAIGADTPSIHSNILGPIARAGSVVAAISTGPTWGNATGVSRIGAAISWCRSLGASADKGAVLIGASHGATNALSYARANPSLVAGIILIIPAIDLEYLREHNTVEGIGGLRASIDAAYGVTYPAPLPYSALPLEYVSEISHIPLQIFWADDDDISTNALNFINAHGNYDPLFFLGSRGHTDAAIAYIPSAKVLNFIRQVA